MPGLFFDVNPAHRVSPADLDRLGTDADTPA